MNENEIENHQDAVRVTLGASEYTIAAGTSMEIVVQLENPTPPGDFFEVKLLGIPQGWIDYSGPPAIWISAGGQEIVSFNVSPPAEGEEITGSYPARVQVTPESAPDTHIQQEVILSVVPGEKTNLVEITIASQNDPAITGDGEEKLGVAAFESPGRVGVRFSTVQFSVAPGGSLAIPLTLLNRGLEADAFLLGIEGIPVSWVSTSTPVNPLEPGETKEVTLLVRPPLSPSIQAGRYTFSLVVSSQVAPDQVVKVDCRLTVAAYTQFRAYLEPETVDAGQPVRVTVQNEGNIQQLFHLTCESQNDQLTFEFLEPEGAKQPDAFPNPQPQAASSTAGEPAKNPTVQPIPPDQTAIFRFTARPRQRPLFGGSVSYLYQVSVATKKNDALTLQSEALTLPGRVISRATIPVWALPIALIFCLCLVCSSSFILLGGGALILSPVQTSPPETAVAAGATQTALAGTAVSAGATQTIMANQTAAAVAGQQDTDGDGLTDQREMELATDPAKPDTDSDGLMDGEEVFQSGTSPLNPDSDADGLSDGDEIRLRTNALNPDTDGDGLKDGDEVRLGTNPFNPDSDGDGLMDSLENQSCPGFLNPDSDQDGIIDGKDLSPCDPNNPALTATAAALQPTATIAPPTLAPTQPPPTAPPTLAPTQPPPTAAPTSQPTQVSLPRFQGIILFESDRDGNPEIYATDSAGHITRMTNNPAADIQPAWAPGLQRIAFTSSRDGQNEIYLMNADGTNPVNLTNNPADDQNPAWSVDGLWIAFTSNREGNYEIYILRLDNGEIRNLTNNPGNDTQPNWMRSSTLDASGEHIVFTSDRDGNQEIYRMKTDGAEAVNLTGNPASDQMAKGAADGVLLAFTTNRDGNQEIYSMRIDGNGLVNATNHPANDFGSSWSTNQAWIAFTSDRDGNREVYLFTAPGRPELYNLTKYPGHDQAADWR